MMFRYTGEWDMRVIFKGKKYKGCTCGGFGSFVEKRGNKGIFE